MSDFWQLMLCVGGAVVMVLFLMALLLYQDSQPITRGLSPSWKTDDKEPAGYEWLVFHLHDDDFMRGSLRVGREVHFRGKVGRVVREEGIRILVKWNS